MKFLNLIIQALTGAAIGFALVCTIVVVTVCGIVGCTFAGVGLFILEGKSWPSPQPYPGFQTYTSSGAGSQAMSRSQIYTATLSLDTMQQYYEGQMNQHCVDDWEFQRFSNTENQLCLEAECEIRRLGPDQFFKVNLCSISETQTVIYHIDIWDY